MSTHRSVSELVNDAVRHALAEEQEDLADFEKRAAKPTITYETLLNDLKLIARFEIVFKQSIED